jgi:hypothetical protein
MVVDLAREVGIVLLRTLQHYARAIRQLVRGKVDLAKAAFPDQAAKGVVPDGSKVWRGELCEEGLVGVGKLGVAGFGQRISQFCSAAERFVWCLPFSAGPAARTRPGS